MQVTRIDIRDTRGRATIVRVGPEIVIHAVRLLGRDESWVIPVRPAAAAERQMAAQRLKGILDGNAGGGAQYRQVIDTLAD